MYLMTCIWSGTRPYRTGLQADDTHGSPLLEELGGVATPLPTK